MTNQFFPIRIPGKSESNNFTGYVLAVEINSQYVKLAYYSVANSEINLQQKVSYTISDHQSFVEFYQVFFNEFQLSQPDVLSIAVAAPVVDGRCDSEKLPWVVDSEALSQALSLDYVYVINDIEAAAYAFEALTEDEISFIYKPKRLIKGNMAILAPGKGLGEAGLFWDGQFLSPFASEGGHTEFSPRTDWEVEFYHYLNKIYGIVSWESVISEEGLFNIYRFLRDVKQHEEPDWLTQRLASEDKAEVICDVALQKKVRICNIAVELFVEFMAREANNLVLKLKATGGLFISGKIPNLISELLNKEKFYKNFIISDKMEKLLKDVPIYLVKQERNILLGATIYGSKIK